MSYQQFIVKIQPTCAGSLFLQHVHKKNMCQMNYSKIEASAEQQIFTRLILHHCFLPWSAKRTSTKIGQVRTMGIIGIPGQWWIASVRLVHV